MKKNEMYYLIKSHLAGYENEIIYNQGNIGVIIHSNGKKYACPLHPAEKAETVKAKLDKTIDYIEKKMV